MMELQSIYKIRKTVKCRPVCGNVTFDLGLKELNNIEKDIKVDMHHLVEKATRFIENIVEAYGKPETIRCWHDIYENNMTFWIMIAYPNVEAWVFEWTTSWFDTE